REHHVSGFARLILAGLRKDYGSEGVRAIAVLTKSGDFDPTAFAKRYAEGLAKTRARYAETQAADERALIETIGVEEAFATALDLTWDPMNYVDEVLDELAREAEHLPERQLRVRRTERRLLDTLELHYAGGIDLLSLVNDADDDHSEGAELLRRIRW